MDKTLEAIAALIIVCILGVIVSYTMTKAKKDEELRSSQRATFDSLLRAHQIEYDSILNSDGLHIQCVSCGYHNSKTLLWFRDSMP